MDNNNKWDELSLTEKSEVMRQAVANGITNLNEIRQTYNEYADGGRMDNDITENKEAVAAAKEKYPMLRGIDFSVYSDPNYRASDYDGYGDIEVFHKGEQKVDYAPEYSYSNPNINQDNVLYNPNRIPERYTQDAINLDAISHLGHNDPTYDTLNAAIGSEYPDAATNEMLPLYEKMTGKNLMKMPDSKKTHKYEWIPQVLKAWDDAPQRYQNAIDGLVRDYIISKEHPDPNDPIYKGLDYVKYNPQWDSENNSPFYLNQLYDYITTGRRPANILPEVTVTGHKHAVGGKVAHDTRYNHATQIYQSYINQGVNPQTALELTNQKIAEKGWTGWVSGDNKRYNNVNSFTDHTIDQFNRLYPDSLKSNNFNQFFQGIEGGKTKYNPTPGIYRQHLLQTRPGVKKRINEYRALQGQSPLSLVSPTSTPLPWEEGILYNPQLPIEVPTKQPVIAADGGHLFKRGGKLSVQNQRAGYAVNYFMNKGLSKVAAAGLVGNLMRESRMDPTATNQDKFGGAHGLAQFRGARWKNLQKMYGSNPTFEQQLDYIWHELNTTHKKGLQMLKSSKTVDEAAKNAFGYYEFSKGPENAIAQMAKYNKRMGYNQANGYKAMNEGINNAWIAYGKVNPNTKFQGLNANAPVLGYNRTIPNYDFTSAVDGLNVQDSIANFSGETPKFQYNLFPPNPTDYGAPIDWSTPEKKIETPTITPKEDNDGLGLLALINQIYDSPKQEPLATYTPQRNNSMFVVSAPTSNDTFLDSSWFKKGGYLYGYNVDG